MTLTPTDITPGVIVTNGKGRFRLVSKVCKSGAWSDVYYQTAYVNVKGNLNKGLQGRAGSHSFLLWSTRLATPEERAEVVKCLNPKGIDHA